MKRQTAMALAAVFAMSVAGTALAAPANPFVDVPAKHWAYDSINKLAQAGVISGYGDGTFKGDKTLTRYEVAVLVGKAMANSDKADAETKKTIEALKAEFGSELSNLGVRVDNLEKNASKIKFTGEVRERYDYQDKMNGTDESDNKLQTRLRLKMEAKVADNVTFHGRYQAESKWGEGAATKLDQAYIDGKIGEVGYSLGRQPVWLGQGILIDSSGNNDGLFLSGGKNVKIAAGAFKKTYGIAYQENDANKTSGNFIAANLDIKVSNNLNVTAAYLKDDNDGVADFTSIESPTATSFSGNLYKSTAFGLNYKGIKNFTVSGEYGMNDSDTAKAFNDDSKAKAWMGKIQYRGADKNKVGSLGVWAGYRNADPGFDPGEFTTLDAARLDKAFGILDNVKGAEFGVEYTVFKNGILTFQYNDLELKKTDAGEDKDKKNFFAHLVYSF